MVNLLWSSPSCYRQNKTIHWLCHHKTHQTNHHRYSSRKCCCQPNGGKPSGDHSHQSFGICWWHRMDSELSWQRKQNSGYCRWLLQNEWHTNQYTKDRNPHRQEQQMEKLTQPGSDFRQRSTSHFWRKHPTLVPWHLSRRLAQHCS